jgi:peptide/nickel transport system permease protein
METKATEIKKQRYKNLSFFRLFCKSKVSVAGMIITGIVILASVFAPLLVTHDPLQMFPEFMSPPSADFWMGTDHLGRCLFSRVIYGTRVSMAVAFSSVTISLVLCKSLGLIAGYNEAAIGMTIMRLMDVILSFPLLILALGIIAALGPSTTNLIITISIVYTPTFARIVNGVVLSVKQNEDILAAHSIGARDYRIISSHILPNIVAPIILQFTLTLSTAIMFESGLSFLGLGTQPPSPSWGLMISESRIMMEAAPWSAIYPGLALSLSVIAFNLVGDGVRDVFDQRLKER